ncbi:threonine ammonia-lyase [Bailinhaonella thermotolerans]|uniref:Pyridoxal-phosphate dependent enzyme n=1 Tax=Bailinhaonella thermotolerans TaxID=1070861 RepID=A0A3A4ABU3_9ACTN|nr:pyridoxal-phosphate dependent enzyme [Bailinhaonella thermotolerans]RJL23023.1 pyridoxal-phosphate dependent enzyme [Bailinhaonella thermotolerans]
MDLDLKRIDEASRTIDPVFLHTPQYEDDGLNAALGRRVLVKVETLNPIRSFKGRGADWYLRGFPPGKTLVCASSGNFGQAMAYGGRARGVPVEVFAPGDLNPTKKARMETFGAQVIMVEGDGAAAKEAAAARAAADPGRVFVEDGREAAIAEGAGTIGVELMAAGPFDTLVLPVGDGALISGVARWVKAHAPAVRVIGVCAEKATAMFQSWRAGEPRPTERAETIADGISISRPIADSVARMRELVDDIVLVPDEAMLAMMDRVARLLGVLPEPAGVAGLTALSLHDLPGERAATVITGANPRPA